MVILIILALRDTETERLPQVSRQSGLYNKF